MAGVRFVVAGVIVLGWQLAQGSGLPSRRQWRSAWIIGALMFVAIDVWGLVAQTKGGALPIGHGAHLGGALCGALFWFFYLRGRFGDVLRQPSGRPGEIMLSSDEVAEFERIRAKLDSGGPESLTPKERDFVDRLRARAHHG